MTYLHLEYLSEQRGVGVVDGAQDGLERLRAHGGPGRAPVHLVQHAQQRAAQRRVRADHRDARVWGTIKHYFTVRRLCTNGV